MNELGKISADLAKTSGGKGESGDSIWVDGRWGGNSISGYHQIHKLFSQLTISFNTTCYFAWSSCPSCSLLVSLFYGPLLFPQLHILCFYLCWTFFYSCVQFLFSSHIPPSPKGALWLVPCFYNTPWFLYILSPISLAPILLLSYFPSSSFTHIIFLPTHHLFPQFFSYFPSSSSFDPSPQLPPQILPCSSPFPKLSSYFHSYLFLFPQLLFCFPSSFPSPFPIPQLL